MERQKNYVGIDVAKAGMDIAVRPTDERWAISNDEAGIRRLVSRLKTLEPDLVLLEASGGLELPIVASSGGRGVAGSRSQPTPGARLRQGNWESWPRPTPWTRRCWPTSAKRSGLRYALCGTQRPCCSSSLVARRHQLDDHAGLGEEPPEHRHHRRRAPQYRGPHRLVGAGAERPGHRTYNRSLDVVPYGGRRMISCAPFRESESRSPSLC